MRVLLLVLIGGGLLWVLIQGFGPSLARDESAQATPGVLLSEGTSEAPRGAPVSQVPAVEAVRERPVEPPPPAETPVTPAPQAPPPSHTVVAAASAPVPALDLAGQLEIASELLHRTEGFPAWRAAHAGQLPEEPMRFAEAVALRSLGRREESRTLANDLAQAAALGPAERAVLGKYFASDGDETVPVLAGDEPPLVRAAVLTLAVGRAREATSAGRWASSVQCFSLVLLGELQSPWEVDQACMARWAEGLNQAQRHYQWNPKGGWTGVELKVGSGDSLIALRKRVLQETPGLITCTGLIARANQLAGETIQPGQILRVPTQRPSVVVDLGARWLLFFLGGEIVGAWPVGVGKPGHETPSGEYVVGEKSADPTWFRPGEQPVPAGDPRNPLGTRWIAWLTPQGEKTHLGFHGTRDPESIGQDESEGCIRMLNRHVEELYEILPKSTVIHVQP